ERLGQLDRVRPDPAGRPDAKDPLPWRARAGVGARRGGGDPGWGRPPPPPAPPMARARRPGWIWPTSRSAWRAANPEMGTTPACSKLTPAGLCARWSAGAVADSA